jgi:hypothetical protein
MQDVQLYIKDSAGVYQRVDLFGDDNISVTESIRNAKDISKVFTTFSKQFKVPASKANNNVFKHYYNSDVASGFDARIRKDAKIELNSVPFKIGKIRLDGVDMRNNAPHAYKITFFGSVVELKDVLGEDKLFSLNALNINFNYDSNTVKNHLLTLHSTDVSSVLQTGISLPLITHSQRLFYDSGKDSEQSGNLHWGTRVHGVKYNQLKYAVRLDRIIDAIESQYSEITFAADSFFKDATKDIHKIYMWCHRKTGQVTVEAGAEQRVTFAQTNFKTYFNIDLVGNAVMENNAGPNDTLIFIASASSNAKYDLIIKKNGNIERVYEGVSGTIAPTFSTASFLDGDSFGVFIRTYDEAATFSAISWQYQVNNVTVQTETSYTNTYLSSFKFNIKDNMPEMNIIDFLSSLFKMFNLVAYVNDAGEIQVVPLDDFYTETIQDITQYIDVDKSQVDAALPFKEIFFKYKDTKTILANQHLQEISNVEWGGEEYTDTGNIDGEIYKVEPDFHHAKYEKLIDVSNQSNDTGVQVGYFVNDNEEAYLGRPLLVYINNQSPNVDIGFVANNARILIGSSLSVNMPSNSEVINDDQSNSLHFDVEFSEYTGSELNNSLFSRFYQKYIESVFNSKNRLTKVSAVLPIVKTISIQLSDVIVIQGKKYRINSMTTNLKDGRTEFELINYYA